MEPSIRFARCKRTAKSLFATASFRWAEHFAVIRWRCDRLLKTESTTSISLVIRSPRSTSIKRNENIQAQLASYRAEQKSVTYVFGHVLPISPVRTGRGQGEGLRRRNNQVLSRSWEVYEPGT